MFGLVTAPQGSTPQYTADQIKPIEEFYAQIPEAAAYTAISGFPDGRRRQRGAAPEAVGGAHAASSSRSPTSCGRSSPRFPARIAFPINPPSLGQSFRSTPIEYVDHVAGAVRRAAAHRRPLPRRGAQVPGHAEPADRPAPQHARGARAASTATSSPTSASPSTPSAARWRRCWAAARSRASRRTASSTT